MGTGNHDRQTAIQPIGVTADDLSATGDAAWIYDVVSPITVVRIGALVTTVLVGVACVVAFDRRILTGSDTGRTAGLDGAATGIITIAALQAAGKVTYKDCRVDLNPGDQVVPEVTTAATSGAARYFIEFVARDETAPNLSDMVLSA